MLKMTLLTLGMILLMPPVRLSADEIEIASDKSNIVHVDPYERIEWRPPSVLYSLSTIGRFIDYEGATYRCYTKDEYQATLNPMFIDYRALYQAAWDWEAQVAEFEAEIDGYVTKLMLAENQTSFYRDETAHWQGVAATRAKHVVKLQEIDWVPWALVVVESMLLGFVGVWSATTHG